MGEERVLQHGVVTRLDKPGESRFESHPFDTVEEMANDHGVKAESDVDKTYQASSHRGRRRVNGSGGESLATDAGSVSDDGDLVLPLAMQVANRCW